MSKALHLCLSVRGALAWDKREAKRNMKGIKKADGTPFRSVEELRDFFMDQLVAGREVLPIDTECKSFDFKTGCRGCEVEEVELA